MNQLVAKRFLKEAAANVLHYTGLRRALSTVRRSQAGGRRIVVVGYHRVVDDFEREVQRSIPGTLISARTLRRHLEDAHALGFEFASMDTVVEVVAGRQTPSRDLFVVTFDDGYRDVYENAFPILKDMGIPSIVYLPTDFIGTERRFNHDRLFHLIQVAQARRFRPIYEGLPAAAAVLLGPIFAGQKTASQALDDFLGLYAWGTLTEVIDALERQLGGGAELIPQHASLMSWDQVRAMSRAGVDFGAHTLNHCVLTVEPLDVVDREIGESKRRIEQELGRPAEHFAYCNGWYSDEVIQALVRHGFRSGVTTEDFLNRIGGDPFALKRKVLWENFSIGALGQYSAPITGCQLDDVFSMLSVNHPVPGRRVQGVTGVAARDAAEALGARP